MRQFRRVLSAEFLKIRRTLALKLAIFAPLLIVALVFGVALQRGDKVSPGTNPVLGFSRQILTLWTILFLPFLGALVPALLGSLEYQNENWKQVLSWPVPRIWIYLGKWLVTFSLLSLSTVVLLFGIAGAGEVLRIFRLAWRSAELPWLVIARGTSLSLLASALLISIQMWISLRWRNFIFGIAVGIIALVVNIIVLPNGMFAGAVFPWSLPALAAAQANPYRAYVVLWGLIGGAVLGALACWRLSIRECP